MVMIFFSLLDFWRILTDLGAIDIRSVFRDIFEVNSNYLMKLKY